jgi:hypothetical protein
VFLVGILEGFLPGMARYGGASSVRFLFGVVIYQRSQGYFLHPLFMAKFRLDYIWLDGYQPTANIRTKAQLIEADVAE